MSFFVSRAKRGIIQHNEEIDDSHIKDLKRKRESTKIAKKLAKEKILDDKPSIIPFKEPEAPDTNDFEADADEEYSLWVSRELERMREEQHKIAEIALDEALSKKKAAMTTEELLAMHSHKEPKSHMKFMQKYYHKGAFTVDDSDKSRELADRDYTAPTGDDLLDKTSLPKEFLVRGDDLHKKGRSKYTHLGNEDTTTKEYRDLEAFLNGDKPIRRN